MSRQDMLQLEQIDTAFDLTSDCRYWEGFWASDDLIGRGKADPDSASKTLKRYHQMLWSKKLPNGKDMILEIGGPYDYLNTVDGLRLSSDTIGTSLMHARMLPILEEVARQVEWRPWIESVIREIYTIGGTILFPKHPNNINGQRGMNPFICDRWDLTLECIRRYYEGITDARNNPIGWVLKNDREFFDMFVDFKGYCDFFFLQDCVTEDYSSVRMWIPTEPFAKKYPYPETAEEYFIWVDACLAFVKNRNKRIREYVSEAGQE